jgi:hypothetical protein
MRLPLQGRTRLRHRLLQVRKYTFPPFLPSFLSHLLLLLWTATLTLGGRRRANLDYALSRCLRALQNDPAQAVPHSRADASGTLIKDKRPHACMHPFIGRLPPSLPHDSWAGADSGVFRLELLAPLYVRPRKSQRPDLVVSLERRYDGFVSPPTPTQTQIFLSSSRPLC